MKICVFSGAGISKESGLSTFRSEDGLWDNVKVEDVCTSKAWKNNRAKVIDFFNNFRRNVKSADPNVAHRILADLEKHCDVVVVTQNIDDLHERAGSSNVIHLHGEIMYARTLAESEQIVPCCDDILPEQNLRPHVVFFDEQVFNWGEAQSSMSDADIIIVVGTSLNVYPAAGLVPRKKTAQKVYVVDPSIPNINDANHWEHVCQPATIGVPYVVEKILAELL